MWSNTAFGGSGTPNNAPLRAGWSTNAFTQPTQTATNAGNSFGKIVRMRPLNQGVSTLYNAGARTAIPSVATEATTAGGAMAIPTLFAAGMGWLSNKLGNMQQKNILSQYTPQGREEMAKRNEVMGISQSATDAWRQKEPWPTSLHEPYVPKKNVQVTTNKPPASPAGTQTTAPANKKPAVEKKAEVPALPKFVGYGGYSDGSPVTDTVSAQDKQLMPGNNTGVFQQSSTTPTLGPANQIGMYYSPEEQKQVAQMGAERDARLASEASRPALTDMSPGSQGAWEKEQTQNLAMDSILNRMPDVSRGIPKNVMGALERVQAGERQGNEFDIAKGKLGIDRGTLGVHQGTLDLARLENPSKIALNTASAKAHEGSAEYYKAHAAELPFDSLAKMYAALSGHGGGTGTNAPGVDVVGIFGEIGKQQEALRLATDPEEISSRKAYIKTLENIVKGNPAKGTVPTKSPAGLPPLTRGN